MFNLGIPYTRKEIQKSIGGEIESYLPQKDGLILAGCSSLELNPLAPGQVFAGTPGKVARKALLLSGQQENISPVFTKEKNSSTHYYYQGNYRCTGITHNGNHIIEAEEL